MKVFKRDLGDIYEEAVRKALKTKIHRFRMGSAVFPDFTFTGAKEDAFDYYEIHASEYFRYAKTGCHIITNKAYFKHFMENERRWRHILQITDFFDFVCRDGTLTAKDIPEEAGLFYIYPGAEIQDESRSIKAAPRRMALVDNALMAAIAARTMQIEQREEFLKNNAAKVKAAMPPPAPKKLMKLNGFS